MIHILCNLFLNIMKAINNCVYIYNCFFFKFFELVKEEIHSEINDTKTSVCISNSKF